MSEHLAIGVEGEETAAAYLRSLGYEVRERNVRFKKDEIDLIAYDRTEKMIVFAEVKTRSTVSENYPIETAVDQRKLRCLRRAIAKWTIKHDYDGPGRIDVICVSAGKIVRHLKDIGSDYL